LILLLLLLLLYALFLRTGGEALVLTRELQQAVMRSHSSSQEPAMLRFQRLFSVDQGRVR
jgi:hypothetical protein